MDDKALHTYVDDHLTGANAVMSMVENRIDRVGDDGWLSGFLAELRHEAALLRRLLDDLSASRVPHRAVGTLVEKAARLKLLVDARVHEPLRDLLEYEMIVTGVSGKRCLWITLRELSHDERVAAIDLEYFITRAEAQRDEAERHRRRHAATLG